MFKWFTSGTAGDGLREAEEVFTALLADDRHVFDLAMAARLGGADAETLREDLERSEEATDEAERQIRRLLLVHASVRSADIPACLMYMSVAKDAERVADLAKNMFGVGAIAGPPPPGEIRDELIHLRDTVSPMITEAGIIFSADDTAGADDFITRARELQRRCHERIDTLLREEADVPQPAATVLTYRHIARILANLINIASAVTMPLDKMDYPTPDEPGGPDEPEDR